MPTIRPEDPATVEVTPQRKGGLNVTVKVPTYDGRVTFTINVERSKDGDWVVSIPWPDGESEDTPYLIDGMECLNGMLYLGAPDVEVHSNV